MTGIEHRVAILWRGDRAARAAATPENNRYHRIFEELRAFMPSRLSTTTTSPMTCARS